jgi:hypothetical protein
VPKFLLKRPSKHHKLKQKKLSGRLMMLSRGNSSGSGPSLNDSIILQLLVAVSFFLIVCLLELAFVGSYLLLSLVSLCS